MRSLSASCCRPLAIREAYIAKAKRLHPDVGGDQEAMRLNTARDAGLGMK
jgi:curved DNA-binding protein CbpA